MRSIERTAISPVCRSCGKVVQPYDHEFYEGDRAKPKRIWIVTAPLYWLGDRGFCSPQCVSTEVGLERHLV